MSKLGNEKLKWVGKHMPILTQLSEEMKQKKPFKGYRVSVCLHIEAKTGYLIKNLIDLGAEVAVCASNPLSTKNEIVSSLEDLGVYVYAKKGINEDEYIANLHAVADFAPHLYIDDGADLTTILNEEYEKHKIIIGGTEETTTGIIRLKKMDNLFIPVVAVNDTPMKCMFDNRFGTAQSTLAAFLSTSNMSLSGKTLVICGYGWCGKGIASRAKGMGASVVICEVDYVKANEALLDGFLVMKIEAASMVGDVFITVTGCRDVIRMEHVINMKNHAVLMNSGHFDNEIRVDEMKGKCIKRKRIKKDIEVFEFENGKEIYLLAEGRLVNLVAGEGHPIEIIDLSFSLQLLSLFYLIKNKEKLQPGIIQVPKQIDEYIAKKNLENKNIEIDILSPEQMEYLGKVEKENNFLDEIYWENAD